MQEGPAMCVQTEYGSRYGLLGAMAREIAEGFTQAGIPTRQGEPRPGDTFLWLNFPTSDAALPPACREGSASMVQYFVDHPFAIDPRVMDALAKQPRHTLALPCIDSNHLLRLRWPTLAHVPVLHGVRAADVVTTESIEQSHATSEGARDIDILVAGSIHTEAELADLRERLPEPIRVLADQVGSLIAAIPTMPAEQAMDLIIGPSGIAVGQWPLMAAVWRYAIASANRARRLSLVRALQGLPVTVFGSHAWQPECTGTIRYVGNASYADMPALMRRARICIAWGPTQFAHSFSERQLLSMASGCATVSDDRLLARSILGPSPTRPEGILFYDAAQPASCRAHVERLLADPAAVASLATAGASIVGAAHTWRHRAASLAPDMLQHASNPETAA